MLWSSAAAVRFALETSATRPSTTTAFAWSTPFALPSPRSSAGHSSTSTVACERGERPGSVVVEPAPRRGRRLEHEPDANPATRGRAKLLDEVVLAKRRVADERDPGRRARG